MTDRAAAAFMEVETRRQTLEEKRAETQQQRHELAERLRQLKAQHLAALTTAASDDEATIARDLSRVESELAVVDRRLETLGDALQHIEPEHATARAAACREHAATLSHDCAGLRQEIEQRVEACQRMQSEIATLNNKLLNTDNERARLEAEAQAIERGGRR